MTKTDLNFLALVDFAVLLSLFSFHDKRRSIKFERGVIFLDRSDNSLLRTGTNEIASFCIDNRLRQTVF